MELGNAVNQMYKGREKLIILGLTGRTGAGCSKVAEILSKEDFTALDIRDPKHYDYNNAEERKEGVIYKFMSLPERWKGFVTIEVSSLILAAALELGEIGFNRYIEKITAENNGQTISIGDKDSKLKQVLKNIDYMFKKVSELKLDSETSDAHIQNNLDEYYHFYTKEIKDYKKRLKDALEEFTCFEVKSDKMLGKHQAQYHLYTFLMQQMGNNIRSSGNPFDDTFVADKYREFVTRIDRVVKIIRESNREQESVRICIDALRNPYEALFFRDKYKSFYMMAISTDDEERRKRLAGLNSKELNNLDAVEYPQKMKKPEEVFYHQNIQGCLEIADIHIYNPSATGNKYYELTGQLIKYVALILHPGLVTPTHLERCMQLAYNAKYNSGCLSRQVGAVVTREDFSIQSVGWNDVPKGQVSCNLRDICEYCQNKDVESYSRFEIEDKKFSETMKLLDTKMRDKTQGRQMSFCFKDVYNGMKDEKNQVYTRALHAEENAFLQISKYGGTEVSGGCLFSTASPCELCAKKAYQLGIKKIYYIDPYPGISKSHILAFGKQGNPTMTLFYGAIGAAYLDFYSPRIPIKDELEMVTDVNIKSVVKGEDESRGLEYGDIVYDEMETEIRFIDGRNNIESIRTVKAISQKEELEIIPKKILWTGSTYMGTKLLMENTDPDIKIYEKNMDATPYKYDIILGNKRKKEEVFKYQTITVVKDEKQVMEPYFAHMVKNKINHLKLRVIVPKDIITEVVKTVYADLEMKIQVEKDTLQGTQRGENEICYEYTPDVANMNYTYAIEWKFLKMTCDSQ